MFSKKEDNEIKEIKEAIKPEEVPLNLPPNLPPEAQRDEKGAPLFVKVDKYKEVLRDIQEMKVFISGVKQIFTVLSDLEAVRTDAIKIMRATLQRLERSVVEIDTELLRPRGFDLPTHDEEDIHHMEDSLGDLQKQLAALKQELQDLK